MHGVFKHISGLHIFGRQDPSLTFARSYHCNISSSILIRANFRHLYKYITTLCYNYTQTLSHTTISGLCVVFLAEKSQSAKICLNFNFGGGDILKLKSQSAKISDNFHFRGGGGILKLYFRIGVFCRIWTKFSTTPTGSCITDSLSHTTYVETKYITTLCYNYTQTLSHTTISGLCVVFLAASS